ncbi:MAG: hypothetical protein NC926_10110 [Candidatus Omnitrophica bacterium]|nr:hypothetical protein [Candidatus Omnitrophota bacterium]
MEKPVFEVHPQLIRASKRANLGKIASSYMLRDTFAISCLRVRVDIFFFKKTYGSWLYYHN